MFSRTPRLTAVDARVDPQSSPKLVLAVVRPHDDAAAVAEAVENKRDRSRDTPKKVE